jgi:hypothetical protein
MDMASPSITKIPLAGNNMRSSLISSNELSVENSILKREHDHNAVIIRSNI